MTEQSELPRAFDLGPLMHALLRRRDKESRSAGFALKNYRDAQSAVHDLLFVLEILEFLRTRSGGNEQEVTLPAASRGACFAQAILLYVRATEVNGERKSLRIYPQLSPEQKELHDRLTAGRSLSQTRNWLWSIRATVSIVCKLLT
jgi:hypothetical protein